MNRVDTLRSRLADLVAEREHAQHELSVTRGLRLRQDHERPEVERLRERLTQLNDEIETTSRFVRFIEG